MADQIIPLTNNPLQTFQIVLSVNGKTVRLNLTIKFNEMGSYWVMDIADQYDNLMLCGVPLITGTWPAANILAQYQYLEIGSAYVVNVGNSTLDYPDSNSLGNDFVLVWSDETS